MKLKVKHHGHEHPHHIDVDLNLSMKTGSHCPSPMCSISSSMLSLPQLPKQHTPGGSSVDITEPLPPPPYCVTPDCAEDVIHTCTQTTSEATKLSQNEVVSQMSQIEQAAPVQLFLLPMQPSVMQRPPTPPPLPILPKLRVKEDTCSYHDSIAMCIHDKATKPKFQDVITLRSKFAPLTSDILDALRSLKSVNGSSNSFLDETVVEPVCQESIYYMKMNGSNNDCLNTEDNTEEPENVEPKSQDDPEADISDRDEEPQEQPIAKSFKEVVRIAQEEPKENKDTLVEIIHKMTRRAFVPGIGEIMNAKINLRKTNNNCLEYDKCYVDTQ